MHFDAWLSGLAVMMAAASLTWLASVAMRNVTIVDSLWSLLFVLGAWTYARVVDLPGPRVTLLLVLVTAWGLRLALYLSWRNLGHEEDRRYQAIRRRNEPNFAFKSLYLVFGLQAVLAWVISLPLVGAVAVPGPLGPLDYLGAALCVVGLVFEAGGDWQLARFKRDPANAGKVMDRGLWRYTRHPNYFGNACLWWGLWLIACGTPWGWITAPAPILMTFLLLRVSGVALLEQSMKTRPGYAEYVARTSAFIPWPPSSDAQRPNTTGG